MKKFFKTCLAVMLCGLFCFSVCACGSKSDKDKNSSVDPSLGDDYSEDIFD